MIGKNELRYFRSQKIENNFIISSTDGLNASAEDSLLGTNVKQEPLSDDECHSEDGYGFDGENDAFEEDDNFIHSKNFAAFQSIFE